MSRDSCQEQNVHVYFILSSPISDNCNAIKAKSHNDTDTKPGISLCYIEASVLRLYIHVYGTPLDQRASWYKTVLFLGQMAQLIMIILSLTALNLC